MLCVRPHAIARLAIFAAVASAIFSAQISASAVGRRQIAISVLLRYKWQVTSRGSITSSQQHCTATRKKPYEMAHADERIGTRYPTRQRLRQAGLHTELQRGVGCTRRPDGKRVATALVSGRARWCSKYAWCSKSG